MRRRRKTQDENQRQDRIGHCRAEFILSAGRDLSADFARNPNAIGRQTSPDACAPPRATVLHTPLLLNEVRQQRRVIESQQRAIDELQRRVALLEQKK